jgi:hypothetical protein
VINAVIMLLMFFRSRNYLAADDHVLAGHTTLPTWIEWQRRGNTPFYRTCQMAFTAFMFGIFILAPPHRLYDAAMLFGFAALYLENYLVMVDPLPPGISRVRQFITSMLANFGHAEARA